MKERREWGRAKMENKLPKELKHPYFFPQDILNWEKEDVVNLNAATPFIYEAMFFLEEEGLRPWEDPEPAAQAILLEWTALKEEIRSLFEKRNKDKIPSLMRVGISYLVELLYWSNEQPSILNPKIEYEKLKIRPVNIEERLEFIISRPNLFHSFMQLSELIIEQEKGFKKAVAINKRKKGV